MTVLMRRGVDVDGNDDVDARSSFVCRTEDSSFESPPSPPTTVFVGVSMMRDDYDYDERDCASSDVIVTGLARRSEAAHE